MKKKIKVIITIIIVLLFTSCKGCYYGYSKYVDTGMWRMHGIY